MARIIFRLCVPLALLTIAACASPGQMDANAMAPPALEWTQPQKRLVLIVPDFRLVAKLEGPRDDWTEAGKTLLAKHIAAALAPSGIALVIADPGADAHEFQLTKLHSAITRFGNNFPNEAAGAREPKGAIASWTLGPGVSAFHNHYQADYALFVYGEDEYETASSVAATAAEVAGVIILLGLGGGGGGSAEPPAPPTGPHHTVSASLVDLRTGKIVWGSFTDEGGFRDDANAQKAVQNLFAGSPL
jgi:hypothetical protein